MTPRGLAARATRLLRASADAETAARGRTFFKPHETVRLYGVGSPRLREIEKELYARIDGTWSVPEALAFCQFCVRSPYHETKSLGFLLLSRFQGGFPRDLIDEVESWLAADLCDNWATVDGLAPWVITPLVRRYPGLAGHLRRWSRSRNLWLRRASVVCLVPMARRGERLELVYDTAATLLGNREDLIHKAVGWLLREAGKTDPRRLEAFLLEHGPRVPRTALRYAIERFPEAARRRILIETRDRTPT